MPKLQKTRLIVSFIGGKDIDYLDPEGDNLSPIVRLLLDLGARKPAIPQNRTTLLLFDDDKPPNSDREKFIEELSKRLPGLKLADLHFVPGKINVLRPTDLPGLYKGVGDWLQKVGVRGYDEVLFHVTSGTPYMQMTLFIYASTLSPDKTKLVQTSNRGLSVQDLKMPYLLASREDSRATGDATGKELSKAARRSLIKDTVVEDPVAENVYEALHDLATGRARRARVLILGPAGSGKWHASRQFAKWRCKPEVLLQEAGALQQDAAIPSEATLLVQRLDRWATKDMGALAALKDRRPDVVIAATFRTGQYTAARSAALTEGLPGAVHLELPPLHRRVDIVQLGKALAKKAGFSDGKLQGRLQHDWLADRYPRGLHDLETLVTTGALLNEGKHLERESYRTVANALRAQDILDDAWERIETLRFDPPGRTLDDVLIDVRVAAYLLGLSRCKSQSQLEKLTGVPQSTISRTIRGGFGASSQLDDQDV